MEVNGVSSSFLMDVNGLEPLFNYAITIPIIKTKMLSEALTKADLDGECRVYRRILLKEHEKGCFRHDSREAVDVNKICAFMVRNHIDCAPVLTLLYRVAARVECLFSALSKIDAPQRRGQTTKRESKLGFLHFERQTLMSLKFADFLKIWESKPRKMSFK